MTDDTHLNSRIDRIEVTLSHVTDAIEKMTTIINRPQTTQWGPILTAIGLLFVAGGGYTTLITMPMEREVVRLEAEISGMQDRELERVRDLGRIEGLLMMMGGGR